jgi:hypothetical protein
MAGTPYAFLIVALLALAITLLTGLLRDELLLCIVGYLLTVCSYWQSRDRIISASRAED